MLSSLTVEDRNTIFLCNFYQALIWSRKGVKSELNAGRENSFIGYLYSIGGGGGLVT